MKPRVTFSEDADGQIEVWVNEAGRDSLVKELQHLSEQSDHFNLTPADMGGEIALSSKGYRKVDRVFDWAKVILRTDEWDERSFAHVLDENTPARTDADYYGFFMTGLLGLVDSAELSGYSAEATALLRQAKDIFWQEFLARHPDGWKPKDRAPPPSQS